MVGRRLREMEARDTIERETGSNAIRKMEAGNREENGEGSRR
jgi:hypothetical protein